MKSYFVCCLLCFLCVSNVIAGTADSDYLDPLRNPQSWQLGPNLPEGWRELHRLQTTVGKARIPSVFVLATDGKNDQIVWFEKIGKNWKMSVIENIPSQKNEDYGFKIDKAKLSIVGRNRILLGVDGSEALTFYEWVESEHLFWRFVP